MRRVVLLYNPTAGRGPRENEHAITQAADALRSRGVQVVLQATRMQGSIAKQAADALKDSADTIFACGGDGTVHDVLQGVVEQPNITLGVLPMGSANVLARHLQLPLDPVSAVLKQLEYDPRTIAAGSVRYTDGTNIKQRYFLSLAGAGADGMLVYRMLATGKHQLGRSMYYLRAAQLFATSRFPVFQLTYVLANGDAIERECVSAMAVRVNDLGGPFSPLVRGAQLTHELLRVALVKGPSRVGLPAWFALSWAGLHRHNRYAETLDVRSFRVTSAGPVQVQADGEWLGRTPCEVSLIPNAVRLLMPKG
jgi:YegS/Rv2252/BmrU family lipid kinase